MKMTSHKGRKSLSLVLVFVLCLMMLPSNVFASDDNTEVPTSEQTMSVPEQSDQAGSTSEQPLPAPEQTTEIVPDSVETDTLQVAAQAAIDALPDTNTDDFIVTEENIAVYKAQLTTANNAIMSFMQAGGNDSRLDLTKFDALTASVTNFDDGISTMAAGNVADDCPWFTPETVNALFEDQTLASVVYDTVYAADEESFISDEPTFIYRLPGIHDGQELDDYYDLIDFIDSKPWSDIEKTEYLLHFFCGEIEAPNMGIKSIEGITVLSDARKINLYKNRIESLEPIAAKPGDPPMFANGINLRSNPIHVWPPYVGSVSGAGPYGFSTSQSVISDQTFRYHFGDKATANVTLGVYNVNANGDIWNLEEDYSWITDKKQTSVPAFAVDLDTISGKSALFRTQVTQVSEIDQGDYDKVLGVYYASRYWDDETQTYWRGNYQQNTYSYSYEIATQLYAGVKQTAKTEVFGGFTFTKTNEAGDKTLSGAEYELYDAQNKKITMRYDIDSTGAQTEVPLTQADLTTDENGQIQITYLPSGSYYLKEIKAPGGYSINSNTVAVTIDGGSASTAIEGGIPSFMQSPDSISMDPDWANIYLGTNSFIVPGETGDQDETEKTAADYDSEVLLTNKKIYGWTEKDGAQTFSSSTVASDYKTISSLKSELSAADADKYSEISSVTVQMQKWDEDTNDWSTTPKTTTYTSLAAAKSAINAYAEKNGLTGDITVDSNTVYLLKDTEVTANAVSQKDKEAVLPANLNLTASKALDGANEYLADDQYKFELKQTGAPEGVSALIPESGVVGYNKADGSISFDTMLSFAKAGTYTFTLQEDPSYRKTGLTDADYQGIVFDDTVRTITVVVEEADRTGDDPQSFNAVVSVAKGNEAAVEVGTVTGVDTNTVGEDGTITPKPVDVGVATVDNQLQKPKANLSATKTVDMGTLVDDEFTFSLVPGADCKDVTYLDATQTEHPLPADGWTALTNKSDGSIDFNAAFSALVFPKEETTYHFTLTENDTPDGSAYNKDATSVPITVTVTKNATTGKFEAAVAYDGSATAPEFENTFKRTTLTASKVVAAGGSATDDFEFTLTFDAGTSGLTLPATGIAGITVGAGNTATITKVNGAAASTIVATDPVLSVTYTVKGGQQLALAGVPVGLGYTVHETAHDHYYDNTDKTGTVEASGSSVSVSNQVKTGDVYVSKAVTGLHSSADDSFTFTMKLAVEQGYSWTNRTYSISQDGGVTWGNDVAVDADATQISFNLKDGWMARVNELPVGTYTTVETEDDTYTAAPGLEQVVKLDQDNIDNDEGAKVDFTNTKKAPTPAAVVLAAAKTVDGGVPQTITTGYANGAYTTAPFGGAFSFTLSQAGTLPLGAATPTGTSQTKTNDAAGAVSFDAIGNLTAEGDYTFQVKETTADTAYVDADGSTYKAVVHVAYNAKADSGNKDYAGTTVTTPNSLYVSSITWTKNGATAASAAFDNRKIAPTATEASLDVSKMMDGVAPKAGAFSFSLSAADGTPMPANTTASNLADGSVSFGDIAFSAPGTYTYTITENAVTDKTVVKDSRTYEAVVTVTDDGTNTLSAAVTYTASAATDITGAASATDKAAFVNRTYAPSYAMAKFRTTDASEFGDTGTFGFAPGAKGVTYKVAVANTGELPLTMDVDDTFTTGAANFDNVKFTAGTGYAGKAFATTTAATLADITTIEAAAADAATVVNSGLDSDTVNVTIQPGSTIVLTITADVTETAQAALDDTAADDAANPKTNTQGYANTATASGVTASVTKDGQTVTLTKDDFPAGSQGATALGDQTDTAKTPVQPVPGYTMSKTRITAAPAQEGTEKFGFFHADTVTYSVEIQNTGNTPLTMSVADAFADTGYFGTPTATAVSGAGVTTTTTLPTTDPVNVSIPVGRTATVTFTADVDDSAPESLSDTTNDQGMGYVNTATTTDVESTYTKPDGTEGTVDETDFPDELGDKEDTANTPVQKAVGTSVAIPVTKTISGGTPVVDDTFTFSLAAQTAGAPMPAVTTASVTGAGEGLFDSIAYTQAGTYEYTVTENAGTNMRYTYDGSSYTYTVVVTEVNGRLQTATSISKDGTPVDKVDFINSYNDEPGTPDVEKQGSSAVANPGNVFSWTITVTNSEAIDIYGVWVKDTAPEYTTITSASGDVAGEVKSDASGQYATWFIPTLKAGQSVNLELNATVNADTPQDTLISNIAHFEVLETVVPPSDTSSTPTGSTNEATTSVESSASTTATATKKSTLSKTGDEAPLVPLAVLALVGMAVCAGVAGRRRIIGGK